MPNDAEKVTLTPASMRIMISIRNGLALDLSHTQPKDESSPDNR